MESSLVFSNPAFAVKGFGWAYMKGYCCLKLFAYVFIQFWKSAWLKLTQVWLQEILYFLMQRLSMEVPGKMFTIRFEFQLKLFYIIIVSC